MKCKQCGFEFYEGCFCPECGAKVDDSMMSSVDGEKNTDANIGNKGSSSVLSLIVGLLCWITIIFSSAVSLVLSLISLFLGIKGVRKEIKPKICAIIGIVLSVIMAFNATYNLVNTATGSSNGSVNEIKDDVEETKEVNATEEIDVSKGQHSDANTEELPIAAAGEKTNDSNREKEDVSTTKKAEMADYCGGYCLKENDLYPYIEIRMQEGFDDNLEKRDELAVELCIDEKTGFSWIVVEEDLPGDFSGENVFEAANYDFLIDINVGESAEVSIVKGDSETGLEYPKSVFQKAEGRYYYMTELDFRSKDYEYRNGGLN